MNIAQYRVHLWWIIPLLLVDAALAFHWHRHHFKPARPESRDDVNVCIPARPPRLDILLDFPTARTLDRWSPGEFQPTASGRPESAYFGSVRTAQNGRRLVPSFHEGIDIAPTRRDRAGNAADPVYAAADGTVAYVNSNSGNSNYGKYVVLVHGADAGKAYTLYAHLHGIAPGIRRGVSVRQGAVLGRMGATSTYRIPASNGHLHFEVGLILNARFDRWFRTQRLTPDHGIYNGWNLVGLDPLAVYERQEERGGMCDLYAHVSALPRAFAVAARARAPIDFFIRYPALWRGDGPPTGAVVMACSENGLPLDGRPATGSEELALGTKKVAVLRVDEEALDRNGCRLVVRERGAWRLGAEGDKWLSILLF